MIIFQTGMQDKGSKTSTTTNRSNRSNKSDATTGSNAKRKSDTLAKVKNNKEKKKTKVMAIRKPSKKSGNDIGDDTTQNKKADKDIKVKEELIEIAVQTQQEVITGEDMEIKIIDLLENSSDPSIVKAVLVQHES